MKRNYYPDKICSWVKKKIKYFEQLCLSYEIFLVMKKEKKLTKILEEQPTEQLKIDEKKEAAKHGTEMNLVYIQEVNDKPIAKKTGTVRRKSLLIQITKGSTVKAKHDRQALEDKRRKERLERWENIQKELGLEAKNSAASNDQTLNGHSQIIGLIIHKIQENPKFKLN
jgi:hypothetical protein